MTEIVQKTVQFEEVRGGSLQVRCDKCQMSSTVSFACITSKEKVVKDTVYLGHVRFKNKTATLRWQLAFRETDVI